MEFGPWEFCGCLCCLLRSVLRSNSFRKCSASSHSCPTSQAFIAQAYEISSACPAKTIKIRCLVASNLRFGQNYISMTYQHDFVYMSSTTKMKPSFNRWITSVFQMVSIYPYIWAPPVVASTAKTSRASSHRPPALKAAIIELYATCYQHPMTYLLTKRGWKKKQLFKLYPGGWNWATQGETYEPLIQPFQSIPPEDGGCKK